MWFKKIKVKKSNNKYYSRKRINKKKKQSKVLRNVILYLLLFGFVVGLTMLWLIYVKFIKPLPPVTALEEIVIPEASIIYDREWNELYTFYWDERRTYVEYDNISQNIINAIVSWEDQNFFENRWYEIAWLFRAVFNFVTWKSSRIEWTSTISQQLIKNSLLTNERSYERKIKELYLSYQLNLAYSKEKILEIYLNKISLWSNASWIEQASRTFFWKSQNEVNVLEASMIASLFKWPTFYSPYSWYNRLVWYLFKYPAWEESNIEFLTNKEDLKANQELVDKFKDFINGIDARRIWSNWLLVCWLSSDNFKTNVSVDRDWCRVIRYSDLLGFLNSIRFKSDDNEEYIEYQVWRKDFILWRMFEDWHIDFEQYREALLWWIWFEFQPYRETIKYPHFVFYVREYLENKYWTQLIEEWWLSIHTTIDPKLQDKAMEIVKKEVDRNKQIDSNNASLISIDNKTWDILAMVWSADYFNAEIDWNVNVNTSRRQPWSSFKPFVYALAIDENQVWTHTPIYDVETEFPWDYSPKNFDWRFNWKMNIMTALNYSRNITAVKAYFLAWEQHNIINFMKKLWVNSLRDDFYYWAPLSLWTWELTPLELASAYSVFANMWNKVEINPILKIYDSRWLLIEEKTKNSWKRVLDEQTAYIMNYILSDMPSRPNDFWRNALSINSNSVIASKTWTSNKLFNVNWQRTILPWDLWTAWYTPEITTVVWAWNTNWRAINRRWTWLEHAAPIWKQFMEYAHLNKADSKWERPEWLEFTRISNISWKLAPTWLDPKFIQNALFKNPPTEYDDSMQRIQVDAYCNWLVTSNTPSWAIRDWYYIALQSIMPENIVWQKAIDQWIKDWWAKNLYWDIPNIITNFNREACVRPADKVRNAWVELRTRITQNETFVNGYNYVEIWYRSGNPLKKLEFLIWNTVVQEINLNWAREWVYAWAFNIPRWYLWRYNLTVRAIDDIYFTWWETYNINIVERDTTPPEIIIENPTNNRISIYSDQYFNLRWSVIERSLMRVTNIYLNWEPYRMWIEWRSWVLKINEDNSIQPWNYTLRIEAIDNYFNRWNEEVELTILER